MNKKFRIALIGNPNCGKTTIFNILCGAHQHVGNYSGVTVERKTGKMTIAGADFEVIDLPGIYGMGSSSPEELVAIKELGRGEVDLILNILDSANLQRNFYLTTQLTELQIPMILVLNMADEARERGIKINHQLLEHFFGAPVVETVGAREYGINRLKVTLKKQLIDGEAHAPAILNYPVDVHEAITELAAMLPTGPGHLPPRYEAIRLLEADSDALLQKKFAPYLDAAEQLRKKLALRYSVDGPTLMADRRYGLISGACHEAVKIEKNNRRHLSDMIDKAVTNRYIGVPIFLAVMYLMFALTFWLGQYPVEFLERFFQLAGEFFARIYPAAWPVFFKNLVIDGILGGVGGVLMFLPNILLLFLGIAFLEGTGYMARAAFIMDGFMHKFGLHGKSFIPMLLGFGCTVPAVMATRTIESRHDRIVTIMVLPLFSCGARLPIYALLIPVFFAEKFQPLILFLIYLIGVLLALFGARLLKSTLFRGGEEVFIMELPPYRMPSLWSLAIHMWERTVMYLKKAGTIILFASIILYLLNTYPVKSEFSRDYEAEIAAVESEAQKQELTQQRQSELLEYSAAGQLGKWLAVPLAPLGFDWKVSSALVGAFAGKELFVSQLGILYSVGEEDMPETSSPFREKLRKAYTPLQGFCIMLFCLISIPCVATVAVVRKETGSWLLTLLQLAGLTMLAYIITLIVYQAGKILT